MAIIDVLAILPYYIELALTRDTVSFFLRIQYRRFKPYLLTISSIS